MSERNRRRKEANRAYRAAGQIYWTQEMERMIVKIRQWRKIFAWISAISTPLAILFFVLWVVK